MIHATVLYGHASPKLNRPEPVAVPGMIINYKRSNMKNLIRPASFKHAFLLIALLLSNAIIWAQDSTGSVSSSSNTSSTTTTTETWYTAPWVWVVGGAILILIIVALTRGGGGDSTGRTDKVTVTKTTSSESV
jgi:hypothetical protein